jgi:hypothetical protein
MEIILTMLKRTQEIVQFALVVLAVLHQPDEILSILLYCLRMAMQPLLSVD